MFACRRRVIELSVISESTATHSSPDRYLMPRHPDSLSPAELAFLAERHLGTLTTLSASGRPHSVAITFTYESGKVRILTNAGSQKVKNVERSGFASVCQVDGRRWLSLEGPATVHADEITIADAVAAYEHRYRATGENPDRVIVTISVEHVLGRADMPSR
jgi:F420H(2)-dependent biliverdin reductase